MLYENVKLIYDDNEIETNSLDVIKSSNNTRESFNRQASFINEAISEVSLNMKVGTSAELEALNAGDTVELTINDSVAKLTTNYTLVQKIVSKVKYADGVIYDNVFMRFIPVVGAVIIKEPAQEEEKPIEIIKGSTALTPEQLEEVKDNPNIKIIFDPDWEGMGEIIYYCVLNNSSQIQYMSMVKKEDYYAACIIVINPNTGTMTHAQYFLN